MTTDYKAILEKTECPACGHVGFEAELDSDEVMFLRPDAWSVACHGCNKGWVISFLLEFWELFFDVVRRKDSR